MKPFMDKDFLLESETARILFHEYAKEMPIADYHCHVSPREIYEDKHFENITEVWLSGDHYKWRVMRANGVDERFITGDADPYEKFLAFATSLPKAIGNPMYHWCHLELQRFFGYYGVLNADTAKEVWDLTKEKLSHADMGVRGLIKMSNVAFVGTTDDPIDTLEWHEKLAADPTFDTVVAPSFRPDKAFNAEKPGYLAYIEKLSAVTGIEIHDLKSLKAALRQRIEYFHAHGCKASDHGLDTMVWAPGNAQMVLQKALAGDTVTIQEAEVLKTDLLLFCAREYRRLGWVMQLHYNCIRNPNAKMFGKLGPDTGYDVIGPAPSGVKLTSLLSALYAEDALPKTILYSLDPKDNEMLDTIIGAFSGDGIPGKIQHGSAWWFNDNRQGMVDQLTSLANLNLLGNFVGMLTDSRSFLSYTRHEYFRRILSNLIGKWVENGEYPADMETVGGIVSDIAFNNAKRYFGLEV